MAKLLLNPPAQDIRKFGPLAYVSEAERKRIMALPAGDAKREIARIEREIETARKKGGL